MRTSVMRVAAAPGLHMEYARLKGGRMEAGKLPDAARERERIREMLVPLVREAVQRQWKEQQDYYRSRPSLAARQIGQMFGAGSMERALIPAVSLRVCEKVEERIRQERIRKGR